MNNAIILTSALLVLSKLALANEVTWFARPTDEERRYLCTAFIDVTNRSDRVINVNQFGSAPPFLIKFIENNRQLELIHKRDFNARGISRSPDVLKINAGETKLFQLDLMGDYVFIENKASFTGQLERPILFRDYAAKKTAIIIISPNNSAFSVSPKPNEAAFKWTGMTLVPLTGPQFKSTHAVESSHKTDSSQKNKPASQSVGHMPITKGDISRADTSQTNSSI